MTPKDRMLLSLDGLSVGDALGETFFRPREATLRRIEKRAVKGPPWSYTDDTEMALSIVERLDVSGEIDIAELGTAFARRYTPIRGYGAGAHRLLGALREGADPLVEAEKMFGGSGSYGNGAAMRVAPLGAFFADDLTATCRNAELSARPTHTHLEGVAGAVAVAVAAALAHREGETGRQGRSSFIERVAGHVPDSETRAGIVKAAGIPFETPPEEVAQTLGSGEKISAHDTVPYTIWCAARHLDDYEEAFWATIRGLGDMDTTAAIVGGIVVLSARERGIPPDWLAAREPLPL